MNGTQDAPRPAGDADPDAGVQNASGGPPTGPDAAGQRAAGEDPTDQDPSGHGAAGRHPSGQHPSGQHPSGRSRQRQRPGVVAATLYLLAACPIGWWWAGVLTVGIGLSLLALPIGMAPRVAVMTILATRWGARAERWWVNALLGVQIRELYRPVPPAGWAERFRALRADAATALDIVYLVLLAPLGTLWALATFFLWLLGLTLLTYPGYYQLVPNGFATWRDSSGTVYHLFQATTWQEALAVALLGVVVLLVAWSAVRGMAQLQAAIARSLLGPAQATVMAERAEVLRVTRERAVDAAAAERRRLERDLHDGAQQRLVSLAMGLGMAKEKFDRDPDGARKLVDEAHLEAKRAIAELRNLARGIHPAVLSDRGLDAALSALAGRSPVPVHVSVQLPERPSPLLESTAYFIVSEALTNVARHAEATSAAVRARTVHGQLVVEVWDNGKGGAEPAGGTGLIGLTDRVLAQDGTLRLSSPPGGPTLLVVELPC